jgi:hypothetical protein
LNESRDVQIEPKYGPSLPELARRWLPHLKLWQRLAVGALAAAVVLALIATGFKAEISNKTYIQTEADARARGLEPIAFYFDYARSMRLSRPSGTYARIEKTRQGTLVASMTIRPRKLDFQSGLASGYLPISAMRLQREASRRYPRFRVQFEGRARVNDVEGYQFAFDSQYRQRGHAPRRLLGRIVVLPEPYDTSDPVKPYPPGQAPSHALLITVLATTLDDVNAAGDVGNAGVLKKPFRSFRFGT